MSQSEWQSSIESAITKILSMPPDESKVVTLASLYVLRDKFADNVSVETSEPKINVLLRKLSSDFQPYIQSKCEYTAENTSRNLDVMLDNLDDVLDDLRAVYDLLKQSVSDPEERKILIEFAESFFTCW